MYYLKVNYKLVGKKTMYSNQLVTPEEMKKHGANYHKKMTKGYFMHNMNDGESKEIDGAGTECLLFDEKICKLKDLKIGKYYLLLTNGNEVLFFKELTEERELRDCAFINDTMILTPCLEWDMRLVKELR